MDIVLAEHSDRFAAAFEMERQRLMEQLQGCPAPIIAHIGSTAVPGLKAKPIIDMMLGFAQEQDLDQAVALLVRDQHCIYYPHYETELPFRRFIIKTKTIEKGIATRKALKPNIVPPLMPAVVHRSHHLHLVQHDHPFWKSHLLFRNALRADEKLRKAYEALKVDLAKRTWSHTNDYAYAKSAFIESALNKLI